AAFVVEHAAARDRMLDHRERREAALEPVPAIARTVHPLDSRAGRHGPEGQPPARKGDGGHTSGLGQKFGQHEITHSSTTLLFSGGFGAAYLGTLSLVAAPLRQPERLEGQMSFKVAIIGAGSIGFTKTLISDLLCVPEFASCEFALTDLNPHNLDMIKQIIEKIVAVNNLPAKVTATTDRRAAISGAKYIMSCVRVGGLEAFATDISIPLKYGVDQCVGDTICAGGILYGQRNIPVILDFCKDIREVAAPGALFLNYANPMAMNTWAALQYGGVDTVGLCHGVQHGAHQIAQVLGVEDKDLDYVCSGINHQTWYIDIKAKGRKIEKDELLAAFERHPVYSKQEKVRIDVLRRFGVYSTESNGHLSEYLPWYRKRPEEISRWIDMSDWIHGETGGYLR